MDQVSGYGVHEETFQDGGMARVREAEGKTFVPTTRTGTDIMRNLTVIIFPLPLDVWVVLIPYFIRYSILSIVM
jgi:hypothetical protein